MSRQSAPFWRDLPGEARSATPAAGLRAVNGRSHADSHSSVCADVVLIGAVLPALGGDALQLLLRRRVGIANLHQEALISNGLAMVASDDLLADVTRFETVAGDQLCA